MFFNTTSPRILVIAAHPDDVEIGAGGFLMRCIRELKAKIDLLIMTNGQQYEDRPQTRKTECYNGASLIGIARDGIHILDYRAHELQNHLHPLIHSIEDRIGGAQGPFRYDVILTHAQYDTHNDHCEVYKATISAARYFVGTLLLYQAPSTIPNEFRPTLFIELDENLVLDKYQAIQAHVSQRKKEFAPIETIRALAKGQAAFLRHPHKYFEAFEVYKTFWGLGDSQTDTRPTSDSELSV